VGIIARDDHSLAVAREEVARHGVKCHTVNADVADAQAIMSAAKEMEQHLGSIDVWVNNAMCGVLAPFRAMEDDEFRRVTDVTYLGYVNGTRAALAVMTLLCYVQLTSLSSDVVALNKELSQLQTEKVILTAQYAQMFDLDTVKKAAESAGMAKPGSGQTYYLDLSGGDSAVVYKEKEAGLLERLAASLNHGVYAVVEYFD